MARVSGSGHELSVRYRRERLPGRRTGNQRSDKSTASLGNASLLGLAPCVIRASRTFCAVGRLSHAHSILGLGLTSRGGLRVLDAVLTGPLGSSISCMRVVGCLGPGVRLCGSHPIRIFLSRGRGAGVGVVGCLGATACFCGSHPVRVPLCRFDRAGLD